MQPFPKTVRNQVWNFEIVCKSVGPKLFVFVARNYIYRQKAEILFPLSSFHFPFIEAEARVADSPLFEYPVLGLF